MCRDFTFVEAWDRLDNNPDLTWNPEKLCWEGYIRSMMSDESYPVTVKPLSGERGFRLYHIYGCDDRLVGYDLCYLSLLY